MASLRSARRRPAGADIDKTRRVAGILIRTTKAGSSFPRSRFVLTKVESALRAIAR